MPNAPPQHSGYAPSYAPPQGPPPGGYVAVTLSFHVHDMIDFSRSTGSRTQEVYRARTLPRIPVIHSKSRIRATNPLPGHLRGSTLLPPAHRPSRANTGHLPVPLTQANISHLRVLLLPTNPNTSRLPVPLTKLNGNHLRALLTNKGNRDRIPLTRTIAVTLVKIHSDRLLALLLRVHPRIKGVVLSTLRPVSFPNRVMLGGARDVDRIQSLDAAPHMPSFDRQYVGPQGNQFSYQYSKCNGKKKALCVSVFHTSFYFASLIQSTPSGDVGWR